MTAPSNPLVARLRDNYGGMRDEAADEIERLVAELAGTKDELYSVDTAAKELGSERDRFRAALELIAAPMRPDGTYNRDRRACELLAREALAYPTSPTSVGDRPKDRPADSATAPRTPDCAHGFNAYCNICGDLLRKDPERPVAWWRFWREDGDEHREVAWGDWPPPEPDDTVWHPLYSTPEGRPADETSAVQGPGPCGASYPPYGRCILMRGHKGKCDLQ